MLYYIPVISVWEVILVNQLHVRIHGIVRINLGRMSCLT